MIRRNSPIVCASHHENRRIFRSIDNMMVWRIRIKRLELLRVFYGAEFGHVECTIWCKLHAKHIVNSYLRDNSPHQIGMLGNRCAHQEAAIASSLDCQLFGRVYFSFIKYSAAAAKSSNTFCFFVRLPALCQSSPSSPPPRIFATT